MTVTIMVIFKDGTERTISRCASFEEAIVEAITLADEHGSDAGDGSGPPDRIEIRRNGKMEISIAVLRGGLIPRASQQ